MQAHSWMTVWVAVSALYGGVAGCSSDPDSQQSTSQLEAETDGSSLVEDSSEINVETTEKLKAANSESSTADPGPAKVAATGVLSEEEARALAKKDNCFLCHSIENKIVGPAWQDVSKRYKGVDKYTFEGKEYPLVEGLMMKVSKGGSGNWGEVAMMANDPDGIKQADIKALVKFILSLQ